MKSLLNLLSAILGLCICSAPSFAGNSSGGGGDFLRIQFYAAKSVAATQLLKLSDERIATLEDSHLKDWLKANRVALAEDILKSKHDWAGKHETCAHTEFKPATISFSLESCSRTFGLITTLGPFAKLLIHESVHHFGIEDEAFADQVAAGVFSLSFMTFECRYGLNGTYQKLNVDSSQQHRFVNIDKFRIRFSNYEGHIYVDIMDTNENQRKVKLSLMGEYLSYYPKDLPSVYCIRM